jgi:PAS domain-containing protein
MTKVESNTPIADTVTGSEIIALKKALARKEFMFQALQMMNQDLVTVESVDKAVGTAATYLWEMIPYTAIFYVLYDSEGLTYQSIVHAKELVSEAYLDTLYEKIAEELLSIDPNGLGKDLSTLKPPMNVLGMGTDERVTLQPGTGLTIPLMVGKKLIGGFHISRSSNEVIKKEDEEFVRVMVSTVLGSLERIQTLQQSQESRVETLIHNLSNGVIMFNENKHVVLANPMAVKMTGLPSEGYHLDELYKLFPNLSLEEYVEKTLWSTKFDYELYCTPLKNLEGKAVGGAIILQDLTNQKKLERELRSQNKELEQFNELMVGRELKMIALKEELALLQRK